MRATDAKGGARGVPEGSPAVDVEALTNEPADTIVVRVARPSSNPNRLKIDQGLAGHGAELPLGTTVLRELAIDPSFGILRAEVWQGSLESNASVALRFSLPRANGSPTLVLTEDV